MVAVDPKTGKKKVKGNTVFALHLKHRICTALVFSDPLRRVASHLTAVPVWLSVVACYAALCCALLCAVLCCVLLCRQGGFEKYVVAQSVIELLGLLASYIEVR